MTMCTLCRVFNFAWTLLTLVVFVQPCAAQLSFHTDANTNSYTIKTPGVQQSFTRYFGGQHGNLIHQGITPQTESTYFSSPTTSTQQANPQSLQYANGGGGAIYQAQAAQQPLRYRSQQYSQPLQQQHVQHIMAQQQNEQQPHSQVQQPQSSIDVMQNAYNNYQQHRQLYAQQQQLQQQQLQQQQQQQHYQRQLLTQLYRQQQPLATPVTAVASSGQAVQQVQQQGSAQQNSFYTAEQYAQFLQEQQEQVLKQQNDQLQQHFLQQGSVGATTNSPATEPLAATEKLLGVVYSPSDKVSHVNFSSGNLNYNF